MNSPALFSAPTQSSARALAYGAGADAVYAGYLGYKNTQHMVGYTELTSKIFDEYCKD
jgi:hypothetical protein